MESRHMKSLAIAAALIIGCTSANAAQELTPEIKIMMAATSLRAATIMTCGGTTTPEDERRFAMLDSVGLRGELTKQTFAVLNFFKEKNIDPKAILCKQSQPATDDSRPTCNGNVCAWRNY
jgi:hypothetical protein